MNSIANPNISSKISRLYFLALTAIALLVIGGQALVQRSLKKQQSDSRVINIAGRQRMLSQKISKTVLLLNQQRDSLTIAEYVTELDEAMGLWEQSHFGLQSGYLHSVQTPVSSSDTIRQMFAQLNPVFQAIYKNARFISQRFHTNKNVPATAIDSSLTVILENEKSYLEGMNQIVFQFDKEANRRVRNSQQIERILLFCTLAVILFEGLFIFMPAISQIQQNIQQVIASEQQTQRANEELKQVNKLLEETREALLEATNVKYQREINEQKTRSAYLIEGQEEERKRVALEIHDGLGQMLTALKYGIEKVSDSVNNTEHAQQSLTELRTIISQTINEARTISFNLMPAVLSDFGIASALKLLAAQVTSSTGIQVNFTTNQKPVRLPKSVEIGLYRISQEAINNAIKYAAPQEINIELWHKKKYIHLKIKDNGAGFKYNTLILSTEKTSLAHGISNMKQRVFMINGDLNISSDPEMGTQIHVKIPLSTLQHV